MTDERITDEELAELVRRTEEATSAWMRGDDPSLQSDERGIHLRSDGKVAWFKDPDGNTFAIEQ